MTPEKVLITSALPYANGSLHFGHIAGAYLPADAYARFCRLMKKDVLFISGSDEYGIAITLSAELAKRSPKAHVDIFHEINKIFFNRLNISFDHFSRTTWPGHKEPVQQFFKDLLANGYIEAKVTEQLFSTSDQKFLADRYVVGTCPKCGFLEARGDECQACGASYEAIDLKEPRSKLTQAPLIKKETKHWFLLLEKFKEQLLDWLKDKDWKPNVLNFVKGYIDELKSRAITRDTNWGIPIPLEETEGKVLYVWFDAPIGYISATKEWAEKIGEPEAWKKYWCDPSTKLVNFIGKDNIPFHAVIFPAMVMGQNSSLKLVDELPANEFYNLEGRQFSKSDGWFIDLENFFQNYTAEQIRYTIAANAPETSDAEFTWKDFQQRCNGDLLGKLGNFVNRVLVFAKNNCQSQMPEKSLETVDREFLTRIYQLTDEAQKAYAKFKLRRASQLLMEIAQAGNTYFDAKKPWTAAKTVETSISMKTTIACSIECLKLLALVANPILPETSQKIFSFLNLSTDLIWERILHLEIPVGHSLNEPQVLFKKIEDAQIEEETQKLKSALKPKLIETEFVSAELKSQITIEDFNKIDLRTAKIIEAKRIPKSKKLLQLVVDLGQEQRPVVAGLGLEYTPEELIGKTIVLVANLKPTTLMGYESQGMLLAVHDTTGLKLIAMEDIAKGMQIK